MPVYLLDPDNYIFPAPRLADPEGLLAVGGDLSLPRLLAAYCLGIYPCYGPDNPILWWSPAPRPVIFPADIRISDRTRRALKSQSWTMTIDARFDEVIAACASSPRPGHSGAWLLPEMIEAYIRLNRAGFAHSVEIWEERNLVGGLYGVSLGWAFFGESMFHRKDNASKAALIGLARMLAGRGYHFIDCQQPSAHVRRLGAVPLDRPDFEARLAAALLGPTWRGPWHITENFIHNLVDQ